MSSYYNGMFGQQTLLFLHIHTVGHVGDQ